jgi:hypothetical protein
MKRRFGSALVVLILLGSAIGCDSTTPLAPTPVSPQAATPPPAPPPAPSNPNAITIAGSVQDHTWRRLAGARVEVLDGPNAGLSAVTDATGAFRLSGEFDPTTRFRATASQYRERTLVLPARCAPCNPNWWLHFSLDTEAASVDLAGEYALTFVADPACTSLPEEFRQRTYPVTVRPDGLEAAAQFKVSVRGGSFLTGYDTFYIGLAGDSFAAHLGDFHGSPGVAERVTDTTVLSFEGSATASGLADAGTVVATLDGMISSCELRGEPTARYSTCQPGPANALCLSTKHQLILERAASASRSR